MTVENKIKIGVVDNYVLFREGITLLLQTFGFNVCLQCNNGNDLISHLDSNNLPELILMDTAMPIMDGYETCAWLNNFYPEIKVLAWSIYYNDDVIIRMLKAGAKGFIAKDCEPRELESALKALILKGFFYSEKVTHSIKKHLASDDLENMIRLTPIETSILQLLCTELTYKEIAEKIGKSPKTIEAFRDRLFQRLNVKSRVGLVLYVVKSGIISLDKPGEG